jgi:hypothetical protein
MISEKVTLVRGNPLVRRVAQAGIILMLLVAGWTFNERISDFEAQQVTDVATSTAITSVLARSCGAASFEELREQGLVEECRLAQDGELAEAIPEEELPSPGAEVEEVNPDVVADDTTATPADIQPPPPPRGPTNDQVEAAVAGYFVDSPLNTQPGYQRAIQRTVAEYLTENPPSPGRPPTEREISNAVQAALLANPPADGADGVDGTDGTAGDAGRGITTTSLDGCDVVFTYSDGSTTRVGPVCGDNGKPGPPPSDQQIAQAVAAYCTANGECRGARGEAGPTGPAGVVQTLDNCQPPEGEVVTNVDITGPIGDPTTITLSCTSAPGVVLGQGAGNGGG